MKKEDKEGRKKEGLAEGQKNVMKVSVGVVGARSRSACYGHYKHLFWSDLRILNIYIYIWKWRSVLTSCQGLGY